MVLSFIFPILLAFPVLFAIPWNVPDPRFIRRDQVVLEDWEWKPYSEDSRYMPIRVPYPWDWVGSGIFEPEVRKAVYRTHIEDKTLASASGRFVYIRFGAVFQRAEVRSNERILVSHDDGYTPFVVPLGKEIPSAVEVVVDSPSNLMDIPHGKQRSYPPDDWDDICFSRSSGIWQPVVAFTAGPVLIDGIRLDGDSLVLAISRYFDSEKALEGVAEVEFYEFMDVSSLSSSREIFSRLKDSKPIYRCSGNFVFTANKDQTDERKISLKIPVRFHLEAWSPDNPNLYTVLARLRDSQGNILDEVVSYVGFKRIAVSGGRIYLNGKPLYIRGVLDQGYSVEGGYYVPPEIERKDVSTARNLGFNLIRYHIKNPSPWYRYWCDTTGMLLWVDVPSPGKWSKDSVRRVKKLALEMLEDLLSSPSVALFSIYNEEWGLNFATDKVKAIREFLKKSYASLKKISGDSILIVDNSGWSHVATDVLDFHYYNPDLRSWVGKIRAIVEGKSFSIDWHPLCLEPLPGGLPILNSEFGDGVLTFYKKDRFDYLHWHINYFRSLPPIQGYVFTELYDVELEKVGLLYFDRTLREMPYPLGRLNRDDFVVLFPDEPPFDNPSLYSIDVLPESGELSVPFEVVASYARPLKKPVLEIVVPGRDPVRIELDSIPPGGRRRGEAVVDLSGLAQNTRKRIEFILYDGDEERAWNFLDVKISGGENVGG